MILFKLISGLITFAFWCTIFAAIAIVLVVDKDGSLSIVPEKPRENRFHQGGGLIIPDVDTRRY
ncbi:hypothetical protein PHIM7_109 [Sinorhizobium phage phiM7]|uniref:Transmembrane protein n=3 Tax=Emdodecavirus TaxID=1980937 RepID=S5MPP4_9CAUD|nr:hypothetical protein AB690_gp123 [Sinorhizobium phage phiM12]YP_009212363.1 hypothetical protein AVT40_gp123 [Sinorhizobium phage phiN3]YP_009601234.1 hypothetical protein FDH46_gp109 [Sinorhizobium phage phiM7]AKF13016.1 hypothetical protein PHIM19_110 [Sinorhizobium phage phiM19]AGR47800.1 hypothetical protein SmphiM12_168 [Sinorhizobium phage phiM12]AKF12656.1 hypothetical protein PHIM7_109 [Sinorhizobium phage phiM7]AKF13388.1 hypothetical protein PHIN3_123 [Sinorhizobium phage phiN3]